MQETLLEKQFKKHPLYAKIQKLKENNFSSKMLLEESVTLLTKCQVKDEVFTLVKELKPWRKGPFRINELFIDSEWQSFIKFNILKPYMHEITQKCVGDIGCNNGYYMFKMLEFHPKKLIGFDPSIKYRLQFELINALAKTHIKYELLGVEHLPNYGLKFDIIFCLGVLYHRSDPIKMLKDLKAGLNKNGTVFLDTMYIEDEREIALVPNKTYSKIPNIYFIPSISALKNWCQRAGFKEFEVLAKKITDEKEQRKTQWMDSYSLENFLDPKNKNLTVEGYEAPKRVYVRISI